MIPEPSHSLKMSRILLVGCFPYPSKMLGEWLERYGFEVKLAQNVALALMIMESFLPVLVITDFEIPGLSGVDLIKTIKRQNRSQDIPVIVFIYPWQTQMEWEIKQAGAFGIMTAPYKFEELLMLIKDALNGKPIFFPNGNPHAGEPGRK